MAKTIAFQTTKTITSGIGKELQRYGMRLSDIHYVAPSELRSHPMNSTFFKEESAGYFERLRRDIKEKGILNPLLATANGKLLAGHNRLRIAEELELPSVPVQYVEESLSEEREKEIIIKDNLLRRQFSTAEWIQLYKELYPDFDKNIYQENRGGDRKSDTIKAKNIKRALGTFDIDKDQATKEPTTKLTAKRIAQETGQTENAVKKHLRTYKQQASLPTKSPIQPQKLPSANAVLSAKEAAKTIDALLTEANVQANVRKKIREIVRNIEKF